MLRNVVDFADHRVTSHRLRDAAHHHNAVQTLESDEPVSALRSVPLEDIEDVVVGPRYLGFLFSVSLVPSGKAKLDLLQDGRIARLAYNATTRPLPMPTPIMVAAEPKAVSSTETAKEPGTVARVPCGRRVYGIAAPAAPVEIAPGLVAVAPIGVASSIAAGLSRAVKFRR